MQARYYDPAVGRFTQLDPVRYGPETFATGQNNRWTYCANDPINASDPSGRLFGSVLGVLVIGMGLGLLGLAGSAIFSLFTNPMAAVMGLGAALALALVALAMILQGLAWIAEDNGYYCEAKVFDRLSGAFTALASAVAMGSIPALGAIQATVVFLTASAGLFQGYRQFFGGAF